MSGGACLDRRIDPSIALAAMRGMPRFRGGSCRLPPPAPVSRSRSRQRAWSSTASGQPTHPRAHPAELGDRQPIALERSARPRAIAFARSGARARRPATDAKAASRRPAPSRRAVAPFAASCELPPVSAQSLRHDRCAPQPPVGQLDPLELAEHRLRVARPRQRAGRGAASRCGARCPRRTPGEPGCRATAGCGRSSHGAAPRRGARSRSRARPYRCRRCTERSSVADSRSPSYDGPAQ